MAQCLRFVGREHIREHGDHNEQNADEGRDRPDRLLPGDPPQS